MTETIAIEHINNKSRESNLELLRCILITMVISVHFFGDFGGVLGKVEPGSVNYFIAHFFEMISIPCVNGFILITGWFSFQKVTFSPRKAVGLIIAVIAYNYLFFFISVIAGLQEITLRNIIFNAIPQNWYVILFVTLIVLSPYINFVISRLKKKQFTIMIIVLISLFSIWTILWDLAIDITGLNFLGISTVSINGSESGYSIVNFVLLYCLGAYLKLWYTAKRSALFYSVLFMLCTVVNFSIELISPVMRNYNNILTILQAVFLLLAFSKFKIGNIKSINIIGAATFGVFLIHTKPLITNTFWNLFNISEIVTSSTMSFILNSIFCILSTFMICTILDIICRWLTRPISRILDKFVVLNRPLIDLNTTPGSGGINNESL